MSLLSSVGVVVIGRNEGERLRRCIESVLPAGCRIVYVDSGSTDGSPAMARAQGVEVVDLDMSIPFCAARARNEGFRRLVEIQPTLDCVQFVDGDCEMDAGWLPYAKQALDDRPQVAIVSGWLRERSPEVSIYNRLGDVMWNIAGIDGKGEVEVSHVGGIFLIRRDAFERVGGFDVTVPAGEEPEMCLRLSAQGWKFVRLDREMALHDLAMTRFGQWWKRQIRTGYGSMDVAQRFDLPNFRRNNLRVLVWSVWLVVVVVWALACVLWPSPVMFALTAGAALLWPFQFARITMQIRRKQQSWSIALAYSFFLMLSYWPQMLGQLMHFRDRRNKRGFRLMEYKAVQGAGTDIHPTR